MKDVLPETTSSDFSMDVMIVSSPLSSVDSDATLYIEGEDHLEKSMQNSPNILIDNNSPLESHTLELHSSECRETLDLDFFLRDEDNLEKAKGEANNALLSEEEDLDIAGDVYYNSLHYSLTLAEATQLRHTMGSQPMRLSSIAIPKNYRQSAARALSDSLQISSTEILGSLLNPINEVIAEESVEQKLSTPTTADTSDNRGNKRTESEQKFVVVSDQEGGDTSENDLESYAYTREENLPQEDLPQDVNTSEENLESYANTRKGNLPQDGNTSEEDLPQDGNTSEEDLPKDTAARSRSNKKKRKRIHGREVESKIPAHLQKVFTKRIKREEYNVTSDTNLKTTPTSKKSQICTNCGTTYFALWDKNPDGEYVICDDCSERAFIVYSSMGMESDNQPSDRDQSADEDIPGKERRGGGMDKVKANNMSVTDGLVCLYYYMAGIHITEGN